MKSIRRIAAALIVASIGPAQAATAVALPAYGADAQQVSVSGLSSGAFMAVQLQVAYSRSIIGAGIVAGGPYYCAAGNVFNAGICMGQVPFFPPNPSLMAGAARGFARDRKIDALSNLASRRIYVFSGTDDSVVRPPAVDAAVAFFEKVGVPQANLKYVNKLPAGHALITPGFGNTCSANAAPFISQCELNGAPYDQPGDMLTHIHGPLKPRVAAPNGQLVSFNQRSFAPASTGMAETAFVYVPQSCTVAGARCKVHVALHGCVQSAESVGDDFYKDAGYNPWADGNDMLVLYPQVNKSSEPSNPKGCWDWWGYTGGSYAVRAAPQMKAIMAMVKRLTEKP